MNRLSRWWTRLKGPARVDAPDFLRAGIGPYGSELPGMHLPDAQAELYQRLSWVYIAVTNTARAAAGVPLGVYQLEGEKRIAVQNHPFELLLRHPNPLQSRKEFLEAVVGFLQITGNAYIWLNRASPTAPPSELWVIPPQQIEPVPDRQLYLKGYAYDPGSGQRIGLETWEISHLKHFHPRNPFVGLSPIEALAISATGDLAMQRWNTNYFHRDHAKPSGALAFASAINESDWQTLQKDIQTQHGGTERRLMMLRNAGKEGVSWLNFGVSQKDMEFLAGRTFNKEEIWAALAPGLASMLAINATEANSQTGRATFSEMTVWPLHQALAEKFTSDMLSAYGERLMCEFDDVRISDRAMALQEQQAAYKLLTIKEAREKFYQLDPLGDERDDKLVEGEAAPSETLVPPAVEAYVSPPPAPAEPEPATPDEAEPENPVRADLLRWQKKASKRAKAGQRAACAFESDVIPASLKAAIDGALGLAQSAADVREVFGPLIDPDPSAAALSTLIWRGYP